MHVYNILIDNVIISVLISDMSQESQITIHKEDYLWVFFFCGYQRL